MIFFDTETCGLSGMAVLIQWAEDDGPVHLFSPWTNPIHETLALIEKFVNNEVVAFNIAFDWFHLCKLYTIFSLYHNYDEKPEDIINELAELEPLARDGPCLKPIKACDLMLHARKGPYQSTMDRGDIRIKRVPTALAWQLAAELEKRIPLKDIYFARKKEKSERWKIYDIEDADGDIDPNFKDIVLNFAASSALKVLAADALKLPPDEILLFADIEVNKKYRPEEVGYAPFAKAIGHGNGAWPEKIRHHISHWNYHNLAREYAAKDVIYLQKLYDYFGRPELGDNDSELACMVAAVRWRGFKIDIPKLKQLKEKALVKIKETPTAPKQTRYWINECLDPTEQLVLKGSTKKILLEEIAKWNIPCPQCNNSVEMGINLSEYNDIEENNTKIIIETHIPEGKKDCPTCDGNGHIKHPAAKRAQLVLDARQAIKEIEIYDKLLLAGRFHASFKVIGSLSSRMSGADGLNPQGIKKAKEVRSCFPLALEGFVLSAGDFAGFEVTLAEAEYNDSNLRTQLLTCEKCNGRMAFNPQKNDFICGECGSNKGKKIHALFGIHVFPQFDYNGLKATEGTSDDKYTRAKSGIFAMMYGGTEHTLQDRLGVPLDTALAALARFHREFPGVKRAQAKVIIAFSSMKQMEGLGSKITWTEPDECIRTMFDFPRYFTLENMICKALYTLANQPPKSWRDIKIKVMRRDRDQTVSGAVQSSLYACAFAIQASNVRAAINHMIQSAGATITKTVQRKIWDLQPSGINPWKVQCFNIHDEIQCCSTPEMVEKVKRVVNETVESFRPKVPLIKMEWATNLNSWADK